MPSSILRHSLLIILTITIGITQAARPLTTPVGRHLRQSTTHARPAGVCLMAAATVSGRQQASRLALALTLTIHLTRACSSVRASVLLPPGILRRVIVTTAMVTCTMSVTSVTVGRLLLTVAVRIASSSTAMARSIHRTTTAGRSGGLSVVSKNKSS